MCGIGILLLLLEDFLFTLLIGCSSSDNSITPEMIQAIKSMTDGNEYVSIVIIKNEPDNFDIMVEVLFEPESYSQIQSFTDAICKDCYNSFKDRDINQNISVWGYRSKNNVIYGKTSYDKYSGKFEFKTAEELNL